MLGSKRIGTEAGLVTGLESQKRQKSASLATSLTGRTQSSYTRAANGTLATATSLGSFPPGKRTIKGTVGQGNSTDFMQIELTANSRIRVLLANASQGRITGSILNANGAAISTGGGVGQTSELLVKGAKPGTYYIRVKGPASGTNRYTVNLFVNRTGGPAPLPCGCGT